MEGDTTMENENIAEIYETYHRKQQKINVSSRYAMKYDEMLNLLRLLKSHPCDALWFAYKFGYERGKKEQQKKRT